MSIGTAIDTLASYSWKLTRDLSYFSYELWAYTVRKTWKPFTKLGSGLCMVFIGSHYYCPMYLTFEKEVRSDWNPAVAQAKTWEDYIDLYARAHKRNRCLVKAVVFVESRNCTRLESKMGALGCMQIMPATGRDLGLASRAELLDPESNISHGMSYLFKLIDKLGVYRGLQAYNAGEKRIGKTVENRDYPEKVLAAWQKCDDENGLTAKDL